MQPVEPDVGALYATYRRELQDERMSRHVRMGTLVACILQTGFVLLDYQAYPERFGLFFAVRMALNLALLSIYFRFSLTHPRASEIALCLTMGIAMLVLIYATGAPTSNYYAGLILVMVGMGVLLPLTALEATGICGTLFVSYVISPALTRAPVEWETFTVHTVFLASAAAVSVASCAFLDRLRLIDFQQRREIEEARDHLRELDRSKSRFTANVHHELRTPLTLMLAPLEAMLGGEFGPVAEPQRRYLETMRVNALRLLKLINNLLDFSKIESREYRLKRELVDIGRVIGDVVAGAWPLAEQKAIRVTTPALRALDKLYVDLDAFEKVMLNLLGNALKFTEQGGRIDVQVSREPEGGMHIVVADDGAGIPPEQLERVFDRFAQVDGSATRRHEGTGIGLALTRELVELHGGRVWAESPGLGLGARFHVSLPEGEPDGSDEETLRSLDGGLTSLAQWQAAVEAELDAAEAEPGPEGERPAEAPGPDAGVAAPADMPEVLVVEDNAEMRRFLAQLLRREFRVRTASNGREGLEAARAGCPDLVLTDMMMPEMTGTDLCRALKEDARTRDIPVVLLTAKAEREMKLEGLELGAIDYVTKPFHPRELLARVRSISHLHQLQDELARRNAVLERTMAELKETEVQLVQAERLAAVGELAAGVAHEVNNPVNFAVNSLRALRVRVDDLRRLVGALAGLDPRDADKLPDQLGELERLKGEIHFDEVATELEELVAIVTEGLERTHRLVADLRDFAGPGRGPRVAFDVRDGLGSTLRLMGHAMQAARVRVETTFAPDLPRVFANPGGLNQVFLNLLKNSTEALEGVGGTIRVGAQREGNHIVVEVSDDGPGIAPEVRDRLFEPFVSTKGAGRGTGLGLSVSRRIIHELGGAIECLTGDDGGACFRVRLLVEVSDEA